MTTDPRPFILEPHAGASRPDTARGTVQWIGTATVLIRFAGFTILTDPNFIHRGERVRLGYGLRSTRRTDPAIEIGALPRLDLVLLSHLHDDHFDQAAYDHLDRRPPIVTTTHAAASLTDDGFRTMGLETWQAAEFDNDVARLRITAMPGKHAPGPLKFALPPVNGSMLRFELADGGLFTLYITGDTLIHNDLQGIRRRYPDIDLALLHLGGTRIFGVTVTMNGRQGVEMMRLTRPRMAIPIHYYDYPVFKEPLSAFREEVRSAGLFEQVHVLDRGDTYTFTTRNR